MKKKGEKPEEELQIGMTKEEALLIFGSPLSIYESVRGIFGFLIRYEYWDYKNFNLSFTNGTLSHYARWKNQSRKT